MQDFPSDKLIRVGRGEAAYRAFVPAPLPPDLTLDMEVILALSDADRALGELAGLGNTLPNPQLFIQPFIRREAVLSSRIEGTQADIADLYAYEAGQLPTPGMGAAPPESDVREVLNYVRALQFGLERINTLPMSLRLIRELHERLMQGVRGGQAYPGEFRTTQNWIGGATLNSARFVPPPVPEMNEALDAFERYLHSRNSYPPLVRLALIHYQFEAIHPFVDGNGRTGRLLISLLLVHWNLLPAPLLYLSVFFEQHRSRYYSLLLAVSKDSAWHDWALFFLQGVREQAVDAIKKARQLQALRENWRERLAQARTATTLRLADRLFTSPIITVPLAKDFLTISYPSAQDAIEKLVRVGILQPGERTFQGRLYIADDILAILQDKL